MHDPIMYWMNSHQPLVLVIDIVLCIVGAFWLVLGVRSIVRAWKRMQDSQRAAEEREREEKVQNFRTQMLIRQCEEWCIDASNLKLAWRKERALKRLASYMDTLMVLGIAPFIILMVVWTVVYAVAGDTYLANTFVSVSCAVALLWLGYQFIRMLKIRRLYKKVKAIQINA